MKIHHNKLFQTEYIDINFIKYKFPSISSTGLKQSYFLIDIISSSSPELTSSFKIDLVPIPPYSYDIFLNAG